MTDDTNMSQECEALVYYITNAIDGFHHARPDLSCSTILAALEHIRHSLTEAMIDGTTPYKPRTAPSVGGSSQARKPWWRIGKSA